MKKLTYTLSISFLLLVNSCTNDLEITMNEKQLSFSSINASMADLPTSRTHLENDGRVVWEVNDQVGIFSDTQTEPVLFTCASVDDSKASFTSNNEVSGNNFYAFYPYENSNVEDDEWTYTLSSNTQYTPGTYFRQSPMIAKSNTNNFKFKHTCGIIRFSITGTQSIQSLVLEGNNGEIIAGTGIVDLNSEIPVFTIPSDASDASTSINMSVNGVQLSETGTDFYFIVPEVEFSKGLRLTINYFDENGAFHYTIKSTTKKIVISKSVMKSFSVFDVNELMEEEEDQSYAALMAFYNATNGDNWRDHTNWGSNEPFEKWYGVFAEGNNIIGLSLYSNNLTGRLSTELIQSISKLKSLGSLNLSSNNLSGSIPTEIDNLIKLENLDLSDNKLEGVIPSCLGNIKSLEDLSLGNNKLTGSIPAELGNIKKLKYLSLGGNQLSGQLPRELGSLSSLEYLNLSHTQISGNIPQEFTNLTNLKLLSLESNQLEGTIPAEVSNLTNLEDLGLSNNKLTGNIPKELGKISTLKRLHISDNQLSGSIPAGIANLKNLEILSFANNNLTGTIPEEFVNLKNLNMFYIDGNMLNGTCSENLSNFIQSLGYYSIAQKEGYELVLTYYYSSNFSRDGEVKVLQTHKDGNGIPIVITGDAFSDRKIEELESYINKCYQALFSEEPYKSFKDYFDVYSILTVSKREKIGTETALNTTTGGDMFALDYEKIENLITEKINQLNKNLSNVTAIVILNDGSLWRNNCSWRENGLSISCANIPNEEEFITTVHHEALGHGFGLLGDEYGFEYEEFEEENKQNVWDFHQNGFYLNVDVTDDPEKVIWKDFLNDERYKNEGISIYEGALQCLRGAYRPSYESIMRNETGGFNAPSRWAIYKRIMEIAGNSYSFDTILEYDEINRNKFNNSRSIIVPEEKQLTRKI